MKERRISNRDKVLMIYAEGPLRFDDISRPELSEMTDLDGIQIRTVISGLRRTGDIPSFDPEDIHKSKTEAHSLKVAESKNKKWRKIWPLVLRELLPIEIEEVTGMSREVVKALTHNPRRLFQVEDYNSKEKAHERKVRTLTRIWRLRRESGAREDEKKSVELAKRLYETKVYTEDLSFWNLTREISAFSDKDWYYNSSIALVMEAYVRARISEIKGDGRDMDEFNKLGNSVDAKWFNGADFNQRRRRVRSFLSVASRSLSK